MQVKLPASEEKLWLSFRNMVLSGLRLKQRSIGKEVVFRNSFLKDV